ALHRRAAGSDHLPVKAGGRGRGRFQSQRGHDSHGHEQYNQEQRDYREAFPLTHVTPPYCPLSITQTMPLPSTALRARVTPPDGAATSPSGLTPTIAPGVNPASAARACTRPCTTTAR